MEVSAYRREVKKYSLKYEPSRLQKHRYIKYASIIGVTVVLVLFYHLKIKRLRTRLEDQVTYTKEEDLGVRNPDVTCEFPIINPFDQSILSYVETPKPISCYSRTLKLSYIDKNGILRFNKTALDESGYTSSSLSCTYSEIRRAPHDDFQIEYSEPRIMTGYDRPRSDFVYVECSKYGLKFYTNFHAHAQNITLVRKFKNERELGVAIIGIDSLSRLNFMRQLPKTYRFVKDVMKGNILYGFNKVGENTLPNVAPMLTGKPMPTPPFHNFEGWDFIWDKFNKSGCPTLYAEDQPEINMFDFWDTGIKEQPTLHYMRTYWLAVEKSLMYKMSSPYCLGPTPKHLIYFEYIKSFLRLYSGSPTFTFSLLNELTHDYLNDVGAIDDDLLNFLNSSLSEGLFQRTVVFILGDHGNRMDSVRSTKVGRIEDLMPLVSVILPPLADLSYPNWREILTLNQYRLTSTYDIYHTLTEILRTLSPAPKEDHKTGMSLFEPVPVQRTCDDAGIPELFCSCLEREEDLELTDIRVVGAVREILNYFNSQLLQNYTNCAFLTLEFVQSAVLKHKSDGRETIEIHLYTSPNHGLFEATLLYVDFSFNILGKVLRVNPYRDQYKCLPSSVIRENPVLRGVCYCGT